MFNEYKQTFKECADFVPGWQDMSLTELCDKYNEYKDINSWLSESYFSALMYKTWCKVEMLFRTTRFGFLTCYDIVVDVWLYILKSSVWKNKDSTLYGVEDAAEIAFLTCIRSFKLKEYAKESWNNRKADVEAISLDEYLSYDDSNERYRPDDCLIYTDSYSGDHIYDDLVINFFNKKNYFAAILIDLISQGYGFDNAPSYKHAKGYNKKDLIGTIYKLDEQYCYYFSKRYKVDLVETLDCLKFLINCTHDRMDRNVKYTLRALGVKYFKGMKECLYDA